MEAATPSATAQQEARRDRDERGRLLPGAAPLNPKGRPPTHNVMTLARKHTDAALTLLSGLIHDDNAQMSNRIEAARIMLDRGWGRAPQTIDINVKLSFDQFLRDMGIVAAEAQRLDDDNVIEAEEVQHLIASSVEAGQVEATTDGIGDAPMSDEPMSGEINRDDEATAGDEAAPPPPAGGVS